MLINLSNHPAYKIENDKEICVWDEKQMKTVSEYGEIVDLPFPNIPPEYTTEEVQSLALEYLQKCETLILPGEKSAVHVTGEVTFCFILIQMLLKKGYKCMAATSERNVTEGENGEKIVKFKFKHFREYKLIQL